jgi:hypothetical protein
MTRTVKMPALGDLWHRWLVLLAEWQCSSHRRSTDFAKSPPDSIVNPVTLCIDLFCFSSFRFGSLHLFFCHFGHTCTSIGSSYPYRDQNGQKDSYLGSIFAAILVPLVELLGSPRMQIFWIQRFRFVLRNRAMLLPFILCSLHTIIGSILCFHTDK